MNDPITLLDIGSSLHQEYISQASGNVRRKALRKVTHSEKSHYYDWLSLKRYLSWIINLAIKANKRKATPRKCHCPS